jgi:antitoxin component of MazEF toxin-antitoxin module
MIQKVLRVGSSAAVTIPKKSLKELGLKIGDSVSLQVNVASRTVSVKAIRMSKEASRQQDIVRMTSDFVRRYRKDLEALAD